MTSRTKVGIVGFVVVALLLAMGVAFGETFGVRATSENRWMPAHRYITRGDAVRWRNPTSRRHTIKAYGGNWSFSRNLPSGEARRKRFRRTGTFRYRCTLHSTLSDGACSGMCGIIHVFSG